MLKLLLKDIIVKNLVWLYKLSSKAELIGL